MAEQDALQKELKQFRTVIFGTCFIIWIVAVFVIVIFYRFDAKLQSIQDSEQWQMTQYSANSMEHFQVVDPVDHKVLYSFEQKPVQDYPEGAMGMVPGSLTPPGGPGLPRPGRPHKAGGPNDVPPGATPPAVPVAPPADAPAK